MGKFPCLPRIDPVKGVKGVKGVKRAPDYKQYSIISRVRMSEENTPRRLFCQEDLCSLKLAETEVMEAEECLVPGVPTPTRPSI